LLPSSTVEPCTSSASALKKPHAHPSDSPPLSILLHLHRELLQKEEGSSTGKYTIVCILDSFDISDGQVMPGSGSAEYVVHYKAIVWRPYKGEVVCGSLVRQLQGKLG
jgi:DNA-directed RNA polymerase II subunit RPB7